MPRTDDHRATPPSPAAVLAAWATGVVTAVGTAGRSAAQRRGRRARVVHRVLASVARRGGPVEKEILGLHEIVGPGAVCLDVGAEFGLYTHVLADLVGPTGEVHAFEPQRGAHRALAAGVYAAGLRQVCLHRLALGSATGAATLSVPRRRGLPVHGRAFVTTGAMDEGPNREFDDRRHESVTLTTLDKAVVDLGLERITLIKADVEGAESSLVDGALDALTIHRPHLLLEIEDRHTRKYGVAASELFDRLTTELGYRALTWTPSPVSAWRDVTRITDMERNYLFSPRVVG